MDELYPDRGASRRRFGCAMSEPYRTVSRHGVCAADLSRESARHRSLPSGQSVQAVRHGLSHAGQALHRCQRRARLAHLGRSGGSAHSPCAQALLQRQLRGRACQHCGCTGCHDHRPVPVAVSLGAVSFHQGAVKLHTLLDLHGSIPAFIHISDGKTHAVSVLDILPVEAGAFYLMDRSYLDFSNWTPCIRLAPSSSPAPSGA